MDRSLKAALLVAALGYFVDVYDLILFSVVRVSSLQDLGLQNEEILSTGVYLINMQMAGMLLGGLLWGILGDKRGRVSVLFGSILLYSAANLANAHVSGVDSYAFWRFIAGLGLAGELGAGITLVMEMMPKDKRGYGTTLIATVGVMGAICAALTGSYIDWRTNYTIGGLMGLALLGLRIAVHESGLFKMLDLDSSRRGSIALLFASGERIKRYFLCILSGLPIWSVVGVLVTFAPEIGVALGINGPVTAAGSVLYTYIGLCLGDLCSGLLSQRLKSRRKVLFAFILSTAFFTILLISSGGFTNRTFTLLFLPLGFSLGYWAVFVTVAAEQFGTNLRATVATSVPNFVRGAAVPMTFLFNYLIPYTGTVKSAAIAVTISIILALFAVSRLRESFDYDLNFIED